MKSWSFLAREAAASRTRSVLGSLLCGALLGCGGEAADSTRVATGNDGLSANLSLSPPEPALTVPSMPEPALTVPSVPEPALPEPALPEASTSWAAGGGSGGGAGTGGTGSSTESDACAASDGLPQSEPIGMTFRNETSETLYLASTNSHCGAWPAFVEFSQDNSAVDIYGGDCVPNCSRFKYLDYQSAQAEVAACWGPTTCPTPFRAIPPGQDIFQMVFPWQDTHHDLPGSCASGATEASVECVTLRNLPDGSYSLRATAYRELSCGEASCTCDRVGMLDWCRGPNGVQQPLGIGVALHADAVLQLGSLPRGATLAFH